jgi:putative ABC transport system permease protein
MRRFWLNLEVALSSLFVRPLRTALTLLGMVIGIVALIAMMALTDALDTSVRKVTVPLGSSTFQVQREPRIQRSSAQAKLAWTRKPFTVADVRKLEQRLTLTKSVGGEMWAWGTKVSTADRQTNPVAGLVGAMPAFIDANGFELAAGRFLTEHDLEFNRSVAVIGSDVAKQLFRGGPEEALGSTVRVMDQTFEVVGVFAPRATLFGMAWRNTTVAVPISVFQRKFGFRSLHVTFTTRDPSQLAAAQEEAIAALRFMRGVRPDQENDFDLFSNDSVTGWIDQLGVAVGAASGGICFLALLVGGIGVMNIMLVSVTERTREIGIRKALGARPRTILAQFITEAVVMSVLGGAIGVVLAGVLVAVLGSALELPAAVPPWSVLVALASSSAIGLIAGIYPAARAARLDPIEALRYE